MSGEEPFLARWSKRKRDALAPPPEEAQAPAGEPEAGEGAEAPFDLSALPDIETLTGESDLSAFMHKAVPDALRNAALRRIWALDPAVRNYVGEALDYAWDWNTPGGVPGFGEAVASEETVKFVRNLLAGPKDHENVMSAEQAQETPQEPAALGPDDGQTASPASNSATQIAEITEIIEPAAVAPQKAEAGHPPQRKHRHGGALPS